MKRDKEEFKAKNREKSFIKGKRPDIHLGRHAENPQEQPFLVASALGYGGRP